MSNPIPEQQQLKKVLDVIVVHGIGEQRPNETVLPVIGRFSEVRKNQASGKMPEVGSYLSMGKFAAEAGSWD